jgi:hypothetical protein
MGPTQQSLRIICWNIIPSEFGLGHLLALGVGRRSRRTIKRQCQHATIPIFDNSPGQQLHSCGARLRVHSVCVQPDVPAGPKAEFRSTPRMVRGSCSFSPSLQFPFPPGALAFSCFVAWLSFGCLSLFCFYRGAGKKVVWSGDVGLWWIASVQLCVSLQKIFS